MKHKLLKTLLVTATVTVLAVSLTATAAAASPVNAGRGTAIVRINNAVLTEEEQESLVFMREEEKLARDVYQYLYELWLAPEFSNIAVSEQRHMDSIARLLERYGITDPVAEDIPGVFTNPELQALYDELIAQGSQSLEAALEVGVFIEETDIADLQEGLETATRRDITNVYSNLLNGSYNHLSAFSAELAELQ